MKYTVTAGDNRHIELFDERLQPAGNLDYTTWLPNKATITAHDNNIYSLAPTGFWNLGIGIRRNDMPFAGLKSNRRNGIVLAFENGPSFLFKRKSLWDGNYILKDSDEREVAMIQAEFKWNTLSFHYEIDVYTEMPDKGTNAVLPLILIYCTKYMRMRHGAAH